MRVRWMRLLLLSPLLSILCGAAALASSVSTSLGVQNDAKDLYWEEEIPPPVPSIVDNHESADNDKQRRPILQWRPLEDRKHAIRRTNFQKKEPHPLRTNVWRIRLTSRNRKYIPDKSLIVEFDARGYCKVLQEGESNYPTSTATPISENDTPDDRIYRGCVGKWNMIPAGVWWNFSSLQFWAEVHLQPFADHPRMLRGIIVRERYVSECEHDVHHLCFYTSFHGTTSHSRACALFFYVVPIVPSFRSSGFGLLWGRLRQSE